VLGEPGLEVPRLAGALEDEHGRALHLVVHHGAGHAAGEVEHLHAPVVGGHERALGRGHGDEEVPLGVLAVDGEGPGEPHRHLRHADERLDVALEDVGVEGVPPEVLDALAGLRLQEALARADGLLRVVVRLVARHLDAVGLRGDDGVLHLEPEPAHPLDLEGELDLVDALAHLHAGGVDVDHLAERERHRVRRRDLGGAEEAAVVEREREVLGGHALVVHRHLVEAGQAGVHEPVLEAEADAVVGGREAAVGVELPEDEGGDLHGRAGRGERGRRGRPRRPIYARPIAGPVSGARSRGG
jgi:hypothetical protein